jgi:PPOX class probable F420-dependent enzyme
MGVELTRAEIEEFLSQAHTLIVCTVGKDGYPQATPVWFLYMDGAIYFRAMRHLQKSVNLLRNPKACFLVEDGEAWIDLRAVMVRGDVQVVEDEAELRRFSERFQEKYRPYRRPVSSVPAATNRHYSRPRICFKLPLDGSRVASWYNRKLRLRE